ncbi:MAG: hypothetical protein F7C07_04800 [Desulfurococcales archaeon]|nr:hypothetical protein [Desulfurococcales archaeon]
MGRAWLARAVRILKLEAPSIVAGFSLIFLVFVVGFFQKRVLLPLIIDSIGGGSLLQVAMLILANNLLTGFLFFLVASYIFGIGIPVSMKRCTAVWTKECTLVVLMNNHRLLVATASFLAMFAGSNIRTVQVLGVESFGEAAFLLANAFIRAYGLLETLGYAMLALSPSMNRGSLSLALAGALCIVLGALIEAYFLA